MSDGRRRRRRSTSRTSSSSTRVRGMRPPGPPRRLVLDRPRRVVRARRRVGLREVDRGARASSATCRATAACSGGSISVAGRDVLALGGARAARVPRARGVDGLPEPRRGAEPGDPRRRAGRRGVHRARRRQASEARERAARGARARADRRPAIGDGALPAPALGRDAAARRDRDGAREGPGAADPRRADDRARRDGRGRGARPRRAAPGGARTRRCSSSATTSA